MAITNLISDGGYGVYISWNTML